MLSTSGLVLSGSCSYNLPAIVFDRGSSAINDEIRCGIGFSKFGTVVGRGAAGNHSSIVQYSCPRWDQAFVHYT